MENKRRVGTRCTRVSLDNFQSIANFLFVRRLLFIEGKLSVEIIDKNKKLGEEHDCFSSDIFIVLIERRKKKAMTDIY